MAWWEKKELTRKRHTEIFTSKMTWYLGFFIFLLKNFWCGPFFKFLLNLLQHCFCSMLWLFGHEACGIPGPRPGIKHTPPALEDEVSTTGLPGKLLVVSFKYSSKVKRKICRMGDRGNKISKMMLIFKLTGHMRIHYSILLTLIHVWKCSSNMF